VEPHEVKEVWIEEWGGGTIFVDVTDAMDTKIAAWRSTRASSISRMSNLRAR